MDKLSGKTIPDSEVQSNKTNKRSEEFFEEKESTIEEIDNLDKKLTEEDKQVEASTETLQEDEQDGFSEHFEDFVKKGKNLFSEEERNEIFREHKPVIKTILLSIAVIFIGIILIMILSVDGFADSLKTFDTEGIKADFSRVFLSKIYSPLAQDTASLTLEISNPQDETVLFNKNLRVTGQTTPETAVVISLASQSYLLQSDQDGNFSKQLNLISGVNEITIQAFDDKGNTKQELRTVYFSEDRL